MNGGQMPVIMKCFVIAAAVIMLTGCAQREDVTFPNLPPETYMAIADSVRNPTVYIQTIAWWGEDPDGEIAGFEYRWAAGPASACSLDTDWVFTEETSKEFSLPVSGGITTHTIQVRAIDDDGAADPTPSELTLPVTNTPPEVFIWNYHALPDTTFPALLVKWHGDDAEGRETIRGYEIWLDGHEEDPVFLAPEDTVASFGYDDFDGRYGMRSLYLKAFDSACDTSEAVVHSWYVKEPVGGVLLVDDRTTSPPGYNITDAFYRGALDSCLEAFSLLDFDRFGGRVYAYNFDQLLGQFDLVIWYNDHLMQGSANLTLAEDAIPHYIESGGRFLLVSVGAIGTDGALPDSVYFDIFGVNALYTKSGSTGFDCIAWNVAGNSALGLGGLRVNGIFSGIECMEPSSEATPLFYIPPGTAGPQQTVNYYLGIMNSWGEGRAALITFPISRSNTYGNARNEFCKTVALMLD
jgi:hypothetical protein